MDNPFIKKGTSQTANPARPPDPVLPVQEPLHQTSTRIHRPSSGRDTSNQPWLDTDAEFYKNTGKPKPIESNAHPKPNPNPEIPKQPEVTPNPATPPTPPTNEPTPAAKPAKAKGPKAFLHRHLHAVVAILSVILILLTLFIIDRFIRDITLTLPASGLNITMNTNDKGEPLPTSIDVRVLAYNADIGAPNELLYYVDTTATVYPPKQDDPTTTNQDNQNNQGTSPTNQTNSTNQPTTPPTLTLTYDIPDSARHRATYTEVCLRDNGQLSKKVNDYCFSPDSIANNATSGNTTNTNNTNPSPSSQPTSPTIPTHVIAESANYPTAFNKVSCAYYLPANSVGLFAWLVGHSNLNEITIADQLVGCAGSANDPNNPNYQSFGNTSFLAARYGFGSNNLSYTNLNGSSGRDLSGLTMQNFFQSILDGEGSTINAGDIIANSLSNNFTYDQSTHIIDLAPTGVGAGTSCNVTYTQTASRPAPANGSDNSTTQTYTCLPVFTVDRYGRISNVTTKIISYDAVHGNEVVGVTGSYSGLVRSGAGTFLDPYTLAIALNSNGDGGLKMDSKGKLAIVAPECSAKQTPQVIDPTGGNQTPSNDPDTSLNKLQWTYNGENGKFTCVHDEDNQQLAIGDEDITTNNNYRKRYTLALSGDNASSVQFIDRDTTYADGAGISINLTGGANIISASVGNGVVLLCPDGSTTCPDRDKTIQVNLAGDNNTGYIGGVNNGGLEFDGNRLKISAPTCASGTNLIWDGSKFDCRSNAANSTTDFNIAATGTDTTGTKQNITNGNLITFGNNTLASGVTVPGSNNGLTATRSGSAGSYNINYAINNTGVTAGAKAPTTTGNATTGYTINVPTFTVNAQGQLVTTGQQAILQLNPSAGFSYDPGTGKIELPGVTACTGAPGTGLYWDSTSNTFKCTTPYRWKVSSGTGATVNINHDMQVSFTAAGNGSQGLSVSNTTASGNQTITYSVKLGNGLSFDGSGNIQLPGVTACGTGTGLSWNGAQFGCTGAYNWSLQANSTNGTTVNAGNTANFLAAGTGGLSVAKGAANNNVTYTLNLSAGSGLTFNSSTGQIGLANCAVGQVLKATSVANGWACAEDDDTISVESGYHIVSGKVTGVTLADWGNNSCFIGFSGTFPPGAGFTRPPIVVATMTPEISGAEVVEIHGTSTTSFTGNAHSIFVGSVSCASLTVDINYIAYGD